MFLGLGDAVHGGEALGPDAANGLVATLTSYAARARELGANSVTFLGTEPLRRAANAARIVHAVGTATHAPLHVLTHEEEAFLTLVGVTEGRPVEHETLVIDIGGGSSEFASVGPGRRASAVGLRLGSARLTSQHATHDPPTRGEMAAMTDDARATLAGAAAVSPAEVIGVGGTASNLVKLLPEAREDRLLSADRLAAIEAVLADAPAAVTAERYLVNPVRARLLPAGAAIVIAMLERYGASELRVSDASLREGAILAVGHAGPSWRDSLPELARGWR